MERKYPYGVYGTKPETNQKIVELVNSAIAECYDEKSKVEVDGIGHKETDGGYLGTEVYLSGGLNGPGEWDDYFMNLSKVVSVLKKKFNGKCECIRVQKLDNDMPDDIFYLVINIDYKYEEEI